MSDNYLRQRWTPIVKMTCPNKYDKFSLDLITP
ncbi:unnamed protein product, partial [Adineta steineri]